MAFAPFRSLRSTDIIYGSSTSFQNTTHIETGFDSMRTVQDRNGIIIHSNGKAMYAYACVYKAQISNKA